MHGAPGTERYPIGGSDPDFMAGFAQRLRLMGDTMNRPNCRPAVLQRRYVSMKRAGLFAFLILVGFQSKAATVLTTGDVGLANGSPNLGGDTVLRVNPSFGVLTSLIQFG